MIFLLIQLIHWLAQVIPLLVVVYIILTYVLDPYHPLRQFLAGLVEPMLAPLRRVVPLIGMLDISPIILILLVQLLAQVLTSFLMRFA